MKKLVRSLIFAAIAVTAIAVAQGPADVLKQISDFRSAKMKEGIRTQADFDAMTAEVKKMAVNAIKGADLKKIDDKDALAWAQVASMAEEHKVACDLCTRYLKSSPSPADRYTAQMLMMNSCNALGEADMLVMMVPMVNPDSKDRALSLATTTAYSYADTISEKKGVDAALRAIDAAQAKIPVDQFTTDQEKARLNSALYGIADAKSGMLMTAGRKDAALAALDAGMKLFPEGDANAKRLATKRNQITIINSIAPVLAVEKTIGSFAGLDKLKGKVVLVDFFAHWCGPCINSFPDMKQLYADYQSKGLEIVGVTKYYGYYKTEKGLAPDAEFGKMNEFIGEHKLPWPVVYATQQDFVNYGVTGIPHVAVIDKQGNVHKIKVGYSKASFAEFRKEIEKMLK